ncbi:NAD(P)-binding protein [Stipitochalara longipes BDJ]|nr:NAD(P)-binding protein [Stipitochalara longipes BDJ]
MATPRSYLVIGGAGAQGLPVVKALAANPKDTVRILTRTSTSPNAVTLSALPNVSLHLGSSTSESDLRSAFKGVTHAFVNLNSFAIGQKAEIYWGIRIFELALESGVQHYLWSSLDSALKLSGYDEALRCGHYEGKAKVAEWMQSQEQGLGKGNMKWSVLTTGPYAEMFLSPIRGPQKDADGVYVFRAPLGEGAVPYIHLDDLALYAKWLFDHPEESTGL